MGPREWICPQELSHNRMQYSHLSIHRGVKRIFQGGGVTRCRTGSSHQIVMSTFTPCFTLKRLSNCGGGGGSESRIPQAPLPPYLSPWVMNSNAKWFPIISCCPKWVVQILHQVNHVEIPHDKHYTTRHDMTLWYCLVRNHAMQYNSKSQNIASKCITENFYFGT